MQRLATVNTERFALGLALSAFDAVATWAWISLGLAKEANPLLQSLIDAQGLVSAMGIRAGLGIVWFAGFKILSSRSNMAGWANFAATVILGGIALYHLSFAVTLLG